MYIGYIIREFYSKYRMYITIKRLCKGRHIYIDPSCVITSPELLTIGEYVHIQPNCKLLASGGGISIGEGTIFAHEVQILARNHVYDACDLKSIPYDERFDEKKVDIGRYVWCGSRVTILPGVRVGDGAVIASDSVVTKDVPSYSVVGGNPAKVLKYRNEERFNRLLEKGKGYIKNKQHI